MIWFSGLLSTLLAQAAPAAENAPAPGQAAGQAAAIPEPFATLLQYFPYIAFVLFLYFILLRPQSTEAKKRETLLSSLKKDDRVVTIGGIIGTVANISANGKEITLKMEDSSKIRFLKSAIQSKLSEEPVSESNPT